MKENFEERMKRNGERNEVKKREHGRNERRKTERKDKE